MIHCPDCDTTVDNTGVYPCPGCDTLLIVTLVDNVLTVRVKADHHHFHHKRPAPTPKGVPIPYDTGHEPTVVPDPVYNPVTCVHCDVHLQSTVGSIRARVMKGLIEQFKDGDHIDPTTGQPIQLIYRIPTYSTGRLCPECMSRLTGISGKPPKRGEFEHLPERIGLRPRTVVTAGMMKGEDAQLKREKEAPLYEDYGDVQIKALEPPPEPVDVRAYRAFNRMNRKSGVDSSKHLIDFQERNR